MNWGSRKNGTSFRVVLAIAVSCIVLLAFGCVVIENQKVSLQNQLASKTSALDAQNSVVSSMNATITNLRSQIASDNASNTELQNNLTTEENLQSETHAQLVTQDTAYQQSSQSAQASVSDLQKELSADQTQIASLSSQVTNLQTQVTSLDQSMPFNGFSIVQITDTQYLPQDTPTLFSGLTNWIANQSKNLNLMMVIHTGDIVNIANQPYQWANANNAMMVLYNDNIPYCWNCGNHDQLLPNGVMIGDGNPDSGWLGGNYPAFNVTIMRQEPYWVADIFDGTSTAVQFSYGNYKFMVVNVEYNANDTVLEWMQTLINTNPNVNVIVATHNFLNGNGTYGTLTQADVTWAVNFQQILNKDPNVFMTVNGHDIDYGPAYHTEIDNKEEIFFNRQEIDNNTGAATARIYTFDMTNPNNPNVFASTYQTYGTPQYLLDAANQFNFSTHLLQYNPNLSNITIPASTDFVGSSGYSVSFAAPATLQTYSQYGDQLTFTGLTLNNATSSFTASALGANITVENANSALISYTVSGNGTQTFSANTAPTSVDIDGVVATNGDGWSYSAANAQVTVTAATAKVDINFS